MNKYIVGYCPHCGRTTKHIKLQCEDTPLFRVFVGIITLGFSEICGHDYECECTYCGNINTISR